MKKLLLILTKNTTMKRLLLILLCLPLLFSSCAEKKCRIDCDDFDDLVEEVDEKRTSKNKKIDIVKQFYQRHNNIKERDYLLDPCFYVDSLFPKMDSISKKLFKIALKNNYEVVLENEIRFIEISKTFQELFSLKGFTEWALGCTNYDTTNTHHRSCHERLKTLLEAREDYFEEFDYERVHEWLDQQIVIWALNRLEQERINNRYLIINHLL